MHNPRTALVLSAAITAAAAATCSHAANAYLTPLTAQANTDNGTTWALTAGTQYLTASRTPAKSIESRGLLEFDLSPIPAGWPVQYAYLSYNLALTSGSANNPPQLQFHGYAGDGALTPDDPARPANPVATAPPQLGTGPQTVYLDLPYVQSLVNSTANSRWLGLYSYQVTPGTQSGFWSTSTTQDRWPKLTITYTTPDVWVTGGDHNARRYTTDSFGGTLVQTLPVPYPGTRPGADTSVRGTAVDYAGRLVVYNGVSAPQISTHDPASDTWTHRSAPNLNAIPPAQTGSVTTVGSYQFASDHRVNSTLTDNGIFRFNTALGAADQTVRFNNSAPTLAGNTQDLFRGQDGLLYALTNSPPNTVQVFNPYSLALLRTINLPVGVGSLAVGPTGEMYAAGNGQLYAFSPDGAQLRSRLLSGATGIDLAVDGTLVVGTPSSGVYLTTTALTSHTQIISHSGTSQQFVTFAIPTPQRTWRPGPTLSSGPFSDPANWTGPVPGSADGGANSIAVFAAEPPAPTSAAFTVHVDSPVTLGTLAFDSRHSHVLTGDQTLTLSVPAGQRAFIDAVQGDHTLRLPVTLASDLTVHTAPGATVFLSSPVTGGPAAQVDLASHNLIWDYAPNDPSPLLSLRRALQTGRTPRQTGPRVGLFSSAALADPGHNLAIGYAETAALGLTTFQGQSVDASALVFLLTTYGDTDLDGFITPDDYARLARGDALNRSTWSDGDFDYNGIIDANDYFLIDKAYAHQQGQTLSPALLAERTAQFGPTYVTQLLTSIPEPSSLFSILHPLSSLLLLRRR